jgi:hypothetical protein
MATKLHVVRRLEETGITPTALQKMGLKTTPLFTHIPVENWLCPLLHMIDLFVNTWVDLMFKYIDYRLEKRPLELIEARQFHAAMSIQKEEIHTMLEESRALVDFLKLEIDNLDGIDDGDDVLSDLKDGLESQQEQLRLETLLYKECAKTCRDSLKVVKDMEALKENGALSQELRQDIEGRLEEFFKITRSSYHGGDFEGNHCRKFMRHASNVVNRIATDCIIWTDPNQRAKGCTNAELRMYFDGFERMLEYFDALSHFAYQPYGMLTDNDMDSVRKLVPMMDRLWRKMSTTVPVKAHMWFHLVNDLDRLRGMKNHHESKIEVAHQVGRKTDLLFRSVTDINKKIDCGLKFQATLDDPEIKQIKQEVDKSRERKFKEEKTQKAHDSKKQRYENIMEVINRTEITDNFPTLLELTQKDIRTEQRPFIRRYTLI